MAATDEMVRVRGYGLVPREDLAWAVRVGYGAGASIRRLARMSGRSPAYIRRILVESGVTIRSAAEAPRPPRMDAETRRHYEELVASGKIIPARRKERILPIPMRFEGLRLSDVLADRG